jgi:hypothetical protein
MESAGSIGASASAEGVTTAARHRSKRVIQLRLQESDSRSRDRINAGDKALISDQEKGASDPSAFVRGVLTMCDQYDQAVAVVLSFEEKRRH